MALEEYEEDAEARTSSGSGQEVYGVKEGAADLGHHGSTRRWRGARHDWVVRRTDTKLRRVVVLALLGILGEIMASM